MDVSDLSHGDLLQAHDAVARLGRLTGTLQSRFAAEISRRSSPELPGGGLARQQGFGTAGQLVARVTGGTAAGAMRSIEAGRALMSGGSPVADPDGPDTLDGSDTTDDTGTTPTTAPAPARAPRYPAVAQAALAGDLSVDAAGLITAGLETLTDRRPVAATA